MAAMPRLLLLQASIGLPLLTGPLTELALTHSISQALDDDDSESSRQFKACSQCSLDQGTASIRELQGLSLKC